MNSYSKFQVEFRDCSPSVRAEMEKMFFIGFEDQDGYIQILDVNSGRKGPRFFKAYFESATAADIGTLLIAQYMMSK